MTLSNCTAVLRSTVTTTDDYGDTTTTTTEVTLAWALIAPRSSQERVDSRSPAVITAATIYGPFDQAIGADDALLISGHSANMDGEWLVDGRAGNWSLGDWRPGLEVAIKRASAD